MAFLEYQDLVDAQEEKQVRKTKFDEFLEFARNKGVYMPRPGENFRSVVHKNAMVDALKKFAANNADNEIFSGKLFRSAVKFMDKKIADTEGLNEEIDEPCTVD